MWMYIFKTEPECSCPLGGRRALLYLTYLSLLLFPCAGEEKKILLPWWSRKTAKISCRCHEFHTGSVQIDIPTLLFSVCRISWWYIVEEDNEMFLLGFYDEMLENHRADVAVAPWMTSSFQIGILSNVSASVCIIVNISSWINPEGTWSREVVAVAIFTFEMSLTANTFRTWGP